MKNDHYGFHHGELDYENRLHPGYDYNGPGGGDADKGTELVAIAPGVITFRADGKNYGWGNMLCYMIDMKQFFIGYELEKPEWCPDKIWVKYAHCEKIFVQEGQEFDTGESLALLGGTGGWSAHCHWDMKKVANGPFYYPNTSTSDEEFDRIYIDPESFIASINEYITVNKEQSNKWPKTTLIKAKDDPRIYYYNGVKKFHIPDWFTFEALFEDSEPEIVNKNILKQIQDGDPFTSLKP